MIFAHGKIWVYSYRSIGDRYKYHYWKEWNPFKDGTKLIVFASNEKWSTKKESRRDLRKYLNK